MPNRTNRLLLSVLYKSLMNQRRPVHDFDQLPDLRKLRVNSISLRSKHYHRLCSRSSMQRQFQGTEDGGASTIANSTFPAHCPKLKRWTNCGNQCTMSYIEAHQQPKEFPCRCLYLVCGILSSTSAVIDSAVREVHSKHLELWSHLDGGIGDFDYLLNLLCIFKLGFFV